MGPHENTVLENQVFGALLRQARKSAQLTQEELAFRVELERTYISLLERGSKSPTLTTFFRLCRVYAGQTSPLIEVPPGSSFADMVALKG